MKKNLGKIILILLAIFYTQLNASTYEWNVSVNKNKVVTNEAIYLKYTCAFSDASELYSIDFNPVVNNEKYTLKILSENEKIVNNKRVNTYEFVVFIKVKGKMVFEFDTLMKKTTFESIQNTVLGRDNVENEEFSITTIKQKKIEIDVVESYSELVGSFDIEIKKDELRVKAYEPYHIRVKISGVGDFEALKAIRYKIDGVKIFSSEPKETTRLTKSGFSGYWIQDFAFVSEKDFIIPEIKLHYFDLESSKDKEMIINSLEIEVVKAYIKEELLDEDEKKHEFNYGYIYYLLTFMAGFLTAKIKFRKKEIRTTQELLFREKVKNSDSLDKLLMLLVLQNRTKYIDIISDIESEKLISLKDAKKELLD